MNMTPPTAAPITTPRETDPSLVGAETRDGVEMLEFIIAANMQYTLENLRLMFYVIEYVF